MPAGKGWVVECDDYTTPAAKTREAAERLLERVEVEGKCSYPHRVREAS